MYRLTPLQSVIVRTLSIVDSLTRQDLVNQLETPRTTLYDNLLKLQNLNIVEKYSLNVGKRGRPLVFWRLKS